MRLFLAGTKFGPLNTPERDIFITENKPLYLLESFAEREVPCATVIKDVGVEHFLLDSGAFTFMHAGKGVDFDELNKYVEQYIAFINKYDVKYFFEMDIDTLTSLAKVESLRRQIEKGTGKKCIPVWHWQRGIEYWKKMCKEYSYVAIGGLVTGRNSISTENLARMVDYARQFGTKVHMLGFTSPSKLLIVKPFSADSCSFAKQAFMGGGYYQYVNGTLKVLGIDKKGHKLKMKELIYHNLREWIRYQKFMEDKKW